MKAASGSTSVREGGRARVYVYNFSSAEDSAADQIAGVSACESERCVWRPCASAEKKMLRAGRHDVVSIEASRDETGKAKES